jgi:hypothetical protein
VAGFVLLDYKGHREALNQSRMPYNSERPRGTGRPKTTWKYKLNCRRDRTEGLTLQVKEVSHKVQQPLPRHHTQSIFEVRLFILTSSLEFNEEPEAR